MKLTVHAREPDVGTNDTLIGTKQDSMLLPKAFVKGAIKQKVLLVPHIIHVAMR